VQLKTRRPLEGRRKFRGKLLDFQGGVAVLSVDGAEYEIPFDEIDKANTLYQFTRADFEAKRNTGREPSGESGERNR
jgi:hypothetical protein